MPDNHEMWMSRALQLARKGYHSTHPNPRVGCVIVSDDRQIAAGFHEFPGGPHAEINALSQVDGKAVGATVYVTLEPCAHTGKTPPCADALIEAQPQRVVIAMKDPNPLVAGKGMRKLEQAGIEVVCGVLEKQAMALNRGFVSRMTRKRPFVRVKMAMSLDGRTALANGLSQWITGEEARQDVQRLRAASSAILSSADTVMADDASLSVRLDAEQLNQSCDVRQPLRVVLDDGLRLTGREKLFGERGPICIVTTRDDNDYKAQITHASTQFLVVAVNDSGMVDLGTLMQRLAELEINEIHTECGARLAGALFQANLVDELVVYMAPSLLGNRSAGLFDLGEISIMSDRVELAISDVRSVGQDLKITAVVE